ncbi:MAG: hypothetical protein WA705_05385 [Candidatus Ozemobacteraceae bacterium]
MRRVTRIAFAFFLSFACVTGILSPSLWAATPDQWTDRLSGIQDQNLRTTLQNSIAAGLITSQADFDAAVSRADYRSHNANPNGNSHTASSGGSGNAGALREAIARLTAPLPKLDRDAVVVKKGAGQRERLFEPLTGTLPASFDAAYNLADKFNPRAGTNDVARLDQDIDAFLTTIADDPVIKQALSSTNTTMADLKRNWFGAGLGFEHVVCGELKGKEVSGYHWWYRFYRDELIGKVQTIKSLGNIDDQHAYTGQFTWDPDGDGPLPRANKRKGGFIIGNSVQAILALGHIAIESARKLGAIPGAFTFDADINGETFNWQCYTIGGTIRSLYPMGGKSGMSEEDTSREYYSLEEDAAKAMGSGSLTTH